MAICEVNNGLLKNATGAESPEGYGAKAFVCQGVLPGLKSDPEAIPKLISFVASAIKKLVAFVSLVVRETEVPFIMTHWLGLTLQLPEVEKFPPESTSLSVALILAAVAFPVIVKIR